MLVSNSSKFAFVHVQKTGGRSVNRVLWENFADLKKVGRRHDTFLQALEVNPALTDYFLFGFVRNPWERLVSWYSMIAAADTTPRHMQHLQQNKFWQSVRRDFRTFEDFITIGVGDSEFRPRRYLRLRTPQLDYFSSADGKLRADFVGRTERLDADLAEVLSRFGIRLTEAPRVNRSRHKHYSEYYSSHTRGIVAHVYAKDIVRFEYEFKERDVRGEMDGYI